MNRQASISPTLQITSSADQVEDQDDDSDHDEDVDQPATDVKGESKEPQDKKNDEDCPKHSMILANGRPESRVSRCAHRHVDSVTSCYLEAMAWAFASLTAFRKERAAAGASTSPFNTDRVETCGP